MKLAILSYVERTLGPKASAALVGAIPLYVQARAEGGSLLDAIGSIFMSGDLATMLPAPLAAVIAFFIRDARSAGSGASALRTSNTPVTDNLQYAHEVTNENSLTNIHKRLGHLENSRHKSLQDHDSRLKNLNDSFMDFEDRLEISRKSNIRVSERTAQTMSDIKQIAERVGTLEEIIVRENALEAFNKTESIPEPSSPTTPIPTDPRNIRNRNPLNIEATVGDKDKWRGEMTPSDGRYAIFQNEVYGLRAAMYLLVRAYFQRHKLRTVSAIIHRWAPVGDNSPESVENYINTVSKRLGVGPNAVLKIDIDNDQLGEMVKAMGAFEGGRELPYPDSTYAEAAQLLRNT